MPQTFTIRWWELLASILPHTYWLNVITGKNKRCPLKCVSVWRTQTWQSEGILLNVQSIQLYIVYQKKVAREIVHTPFPLRHFFRIPLPGRSVKNAIDFYYYPEHKLIHPGAPLIRYPKNLISSQVFAAVTLNDQSSMAAQKVWATWIAGRRRPWGMEIQPGYLTGEENKAQSG